MKTFSIKASEIEKKWIVIDAKHAVVGRLAAFVASILRGKNKPEYTPHMDCGDNVIIINANEVHFTGKKKKDKIYYRHTGYPGGIKSTTPENILDGKYPDRVMKMAVWRMMDDGPMARRRMKNLYIYSGPHHKHEAQKPISVNFSNLNSKNNKGLGNEQ